MTSRVRNVVRGSLVALLALAGSAAAQERDQPSIAELADAYLQPVVNSGLFSGTILLAKDGQIVAHKSYGLADIEKGHPNTEQTLHKLMSVTKSITAVAVLRLAQSEKLAVEDPVAQHLPKWPEGWKDVQVRHLLDHTSGITNLEGEWVGEWRNGHERELGVWNRLAPRLASHTLDSEPGTQHRYSNFNYVLLGAIAEAVSGRGYAEIVSKQVLEPAGMSETGCDDGTARQGLARGYFRDHEGTPEARGQDMSMILAAGGLYSTAADLYRFDRALRDDTLLNAQMRKRMVTPAPNTYGYALGWQVRSVRGKNCVRHSGGANGYVADLLRFPDEDACVVLVSNFAFSPSVSIAENLAGCLFRQDVETPIVIPPKELLRFGGSYRGAKSTAVVRRAGGCLALYELQDGASRASPYLLIALGDQRFHRQAWPPILRFDPRDEEPSIIRLLGPQPAEFARIELTQGAWKGVSGTYREKDNGSTFRVTSHKGGMALSLPEEWGRTRHEIVVVDDDRALTLYGGDFATTLERIPKSKDSKKGGLRWTTNDGRVLELMR